MKYRIVTCIFIILLAGPVFSADTNIFHHFTLPENRSLLAQILDVDVQGRRVLLERKDFASNWIDVDRLDQTDHRYITEWYDSQRLISEDNLTISVKEKNYSRRPAREGDLWHRETLHESVLTLESSVPEAINSVWIEYCYYIMTESSEETASETRTEFGFVDVGSLANGVKQVVKTERVSLSSEYTRVKESSVFGTSFREDTKKADKLIGVWIRVYGSGQNGVPAVREICIPDDLHDRVTWHDARLSGQMI